MPYIFWARKTAYGLTALAALFFATKAAQAQALSLNLAPPSPAVMSAEPAVVTSTEPSAASGAAASGPGSESSSAAGFDADAAGVAGNLTSAEVLRTAVAGEGNGGANGGAGGSGGWHHRSDKGALAFEIGGGFNAPIGNDIPYITWGGNFTVGAGLHLSDRISVLGEYQFMDNKLPGAFIASTGYPGDSGNSYINSITVSPVIDLFPEHSHSIYATGGFGWYHKKTEFSQQACCDFFGYPVTITDYEFSSDQWGGNIGFGYSYKLGGRFGEGRTKLFAEARYLFIHTPAIGENNGLGRTELIPVTLGVRW